MNKTYINVFNLFDEIENEILELIGWDVISNWNLKEHQIDNNYHKLNWTILSTKLLTSYIMFKYSDKINWRIFLLNKYPKSINGLIPNKEKILKNSDIFHNNNIRRQYYTNNFIYYFPEVVNWKWVSRHVKLNEQNIIKYWNYLNKKLISKYQMISEQFMMTHKKELCWRQLCKKPLSSNCVIHCKNYVSWCILLKNNKYDSAILEQIKDYFYGSSEVIASTQILSNEFIDKNCHWLDMETISEYQNISYDLLKKHINNLSLEKLLKNPNMNTANGIQIWKNPIGKIFIIPPSEIIDYDTINFID